MQDNRVDDPWGGLGAPAGLCRTCEHAHLTVTRRGTTYLRCLRATTDPRFPRHPRLPVSACPGHEPRADV
ncbi:MAG: hypothetical protein ACLGH4_04795 [Actinomycetes bacterium]